MLSARDEVEDRVAGLQAGADDYLVKPFAIAEITARLKALLRRHGAEGAGPHMAGDIVVDPRRHVATRNGRELGLTRREFDLLDVFVRHPGQVLSRDQLLSLVWGYTSPTSRRTWSTSSSATCAASSRAAASRGSSTPCAVSGGRCGHEGAAQPARADRARRGRGGRPLRGCSPEAC